MMRVLFTSLIVSLLTGCAVFPRQDTSSLGFPNYDTTPVSAKEMQLLVPGEWYQVRLPEKDGHSHMVRGIFRNGYVGRLQECDEDSLTLTDVTKCSSFDSTSTLRHLPLGGSYFENVWETCKKKSGPVTVRRTQAMWVQPISAEEADKFRRYDEMMDQTFELAANIDPTSENAQIAALEHRGADTSFLIPQPQREEVLVRRRIEIREMQAGQWYFVVMRREGQGSSRNKKVHLGLVRQANGDAITLTNVVTQSFDITRGALRGTVPIGTSSELMLPRSQIEYVRQYTPEQAAELIAEINEPREPMLSEGK